MQQINGSMAPTETDDAILGFFGPYRFLSNFHTCTVQLDGEIYPSSEHAFMAQKTLDPVEKAQFTREHGLTAREAKQAGQTVKLRDDWATYRDEAMYRALYAKFSQNQGLRSWLLKTGEKYLEETNYWKDTYWGVCNGVGENKLGSVLMMVREELRNNK